MGVKRAAISCLMAVVAGMCWTPLGIAVPIDAGLIEEVSGTASAAGKRALSAHDDAYIGDDVTTSSLSRARLALGHDTIVRLGENASLRIDRYLLDAGGVLTIGTGFAGPSKGVIGVFVTHGVVDLTSGGVTVPLHDGEGSDVARRGATPTAPKVWGAARVQAALGSIE